MTTPDAIAQLVKAAFYEGYDAGRRDGRNHEKWPHERWETSHALDALTGLEVPPLEAPPIVVAPLEALPLVVPPLEAPPIEPPLTELREAYTIGDRSLYDPWLAKDRNVYKLGVHPEFGYGGSPVWKTAAEAQAYLDSIQLNGYSVYRLKFKDTWATDVTSEPGPDDGLHHLVIDVRMEAL